MERNASLKATGLTAASLVAFAANSLLCRLALAQRQIDAASFTAVRLVGGAVVLGLLAASQLRAHPWPGSLYSTAALVLYAAPFSFAYLRLGAGLGALVLFGAVQTTMIVWGFVRGERASRATWIGFAIAVAGLVGLTAPGATAPDALGTAAMALAGVAWGVYSLRGRTSQAPPLATTAANFVGAVPVAGALMLAAACTSTIHLSRSGVGLALASGVLASGVGYSLWYMALRHLSATRAAILQLLVPILAAAAAVVLLGEPITLRMALAGSAILGGVALAIRA
jgi:drug/metabolite transporter (DMT)-like permease